MLWWTGNLKIKYILIILYPDVVLEINKIKRNEDNVFSSSTYVIIIMTYCAIWLCRGKPKFGRKKL